MQLLPILGTVGPREDAAPHAAALGKAFQLTNFIRDVDEDLSRGRVYLPADELAAHGVDRELLSWCQTNRRTDPRVRRALVDQARRSARRVYTRARQGIEMLAPGVAPVRRCGVDAVLRDPGADRGDRFPDLRPARHGG